ncbi:hypothetical protein N9X89_03300 [Luminiphilus sp.]|jgi:hypothetical protein|nr:hypothetical protein [Luminiphilus sp.]MDB2623305.1 hypothetical protein [Luminiphilus sp.]MDB2629946.1 hypothetical protein [Luminiphilus sp.]
MRALDAFSGVQNAYLGTSDAHSDQAAMWTRNPTGKLTSGRLALEFSDAAIDWQRAVDVAAQLGAEVHWCKGATPLTPPLLTQETFSGTMQLCCFERREGLPDAALEQIWFQEHVQVALDTQNTLGYRQNLVLRSSHDQLDGIVEEYFSIEAANSLTAFFADGDDEVKMMSNIHVLTESSERLLDLERSSVIHMTEHRLR